MKYKWNQNSISNLFKKATELGEVSIDLETKQKAILFTYALYNFRRLRRGSEIGQLYMTYSISYEENIVTIFKSQPEIKIISERSVSQPNLDRVSQEQSIQDD